MQLQLLKCHGDRTEAVGEKRSDDGGSHRQLSLHHDDEVQVPEAHVHARDPTDAVTSHPRPDVDVKTRKNPLPGAPTIVVSNHQLVNLYLRVWPGRCAQRTQGFILVRTECPYVQSITTRVTDTSL